jgi:hypothetical protein
MSEMHPAFSTLLRLFEASGWFKWLAFRLYLVRMRVPSTSENFFLLPGRGISAADHNPKIFMVEISILQVKSASFLAFRQNASPRSCDTLE